MNESVPIGMEMESASCIAEMRAAQRRKKTWWCKKCDYYNNLEDDSCRSCGHRRDRKKSL